MLLRFLQNEHPRPSPPGLSTPFAEFRVGERGRATMASPLHAGSARPGFRARAVRRETEAGRRE